MTTTVTPTCLTLSTTIASNSDTVKAVIPDQIQQNLLISKALLTSPHNLVERGLLTPDVLSNFFFYLLNKFSMT